MKIYLVEDAPLLRTRLEAMLAAIPGASVVGHAADAGPAIAEILALQPDLVVLDVQLAASSGFDVLRALRKQAPHIDVYMLSNFAADPYRQLAERLGAKQYFDKSREFERVRDIVAERAAHNHQQGRETSCPQ